MHLATSFIGGRYGAPSVTGPIQALTLARAAWSGYTEAGGIMPLSTTSRGV